MKKLGKFLTLTFIVSVITFTVFTSTNIVISVDAYSSEPVYQEISKSWQPNRVGHVSGNAILKSNSCWSNPGSSWVVVSGSRIVYNGRRGPVWCDLSWNFFHYVDVQINGITRTGWIHGDHLRF